MTVKELEKRLSGILGLPYGGIALARDTPTGKFVLYCWGDAPVSISIMGYGKTLEEVLLSYHRWTAKNHTPGGKRKKKVWYYPRVPK